MRVAVVGAGPSGIYAAEHLASQYQVEVDVFDTLPVPFGLVRYGVAPDHFSIRSVRDKLAQTFENPLVRITSQFDRCGTNWPKHLRTHLFDSEVT